MPLNNPGASTAPLSSPAPASPSMRGFTAPVTVGPHMRGESVSIYRPVATSAARLDLRSRRLLFSGRRGMIPPSNDVQQGGFRDERPARRHYNRFHAAPAAVQQ